MKIFIVFAGLLLVNISIISYQGDFGKYLYIKRTLDEIAFECVELASADTDEALKFTDGMLKYTIGNLRNINVNDYSCDVFSDGDYLYARVEMNVEGLFKFPFMACVRIAAERRCKLQ